MTRRRRRGRRGRRRRRRRGGGGAFQGKCAFAVSIRRLATTRGTWHGHPYYSPPPPPPWPRPRRPLRCRPTGPFENGPVFEKKKKNTKRKNAKKKIQFKTRFDRNLKFFKKLEKKKHYSTRSRRNELRKMESTYSRTRCTVTDERTRLRTFSGNNVFLNKMFETLSGRNRFEKLDSFAFTTANKRRIGLIRYLKLFWYLILVPRRMRCELKYELPSIDGLVFFLFSEFSCFILLNKFVV